MARAAHLPAARGGRGLRFAAGSAVISIGLVLPIVTTSNHLMDLPPPITIHVGARAEYVPPGTTFGAIVTRFGLRAKDGNLLSVDGRVLQRARYPGALLLDAVPVAAGRDPVLRPSDRITIRNGRNHVEPLFRTQITVPPGTPSNPQRTLTTTPGFITVTKGSLSGALVSWVFTPTGPSRTPRAVALTFDDGPWTSTTPKVLAVLRKFKVRATFFLVGYLAKEHPDLVAAERGAGMAIGDHSWDHPLNPPFARQPTRKVRAEIGLTKDTLAADGVGTGLFRPPGGSYGATTLDVARSLGMRVVLWSVDPADWTDGISSETIVKRVLSNVGPGSIVLLHDGGGNQMATVKALPAIIKGIRKRHLGFVTLRA
jgi:peptidoglycan/xylan/chitin deacetylase (PgdA/CDA1 family)